MSNDKRIRIASGQGFWGDLQRAPKDQVRLASAESPVHYLMMDYLAEVTMSILQKQRQKNPALGYARDFPEVIGELLPMLRQKGIKVISNAGGVNPLACRERLFALAKAQGISGLKIGVVYGDDILPQLPELIRRGEEFSNMDTGEPLSPVQSRVQSANVYFGAAPIAACLRGGADIVITGRCTDTGLTLGPLMYEFDWSENDWNRLAAGTVAGHLLECGAQASGGNFLGDWRSVPHLEKIGFPIAEVRESGEFLITKHPNTGGLISPAVIKEQLLYEISDPKTYITPDCVADFTTIQVEDAGQDRVKISGIKGAPATPFYKVSMAYTNGWYAFGSLTYSFPDPLEKAKHADAILRARLENMGLRFEEIRTEFIGATACHHHLEQTQQINEVQMRVGVYDHDKDKVERFGYEIAPLILTGPPAVTGFAGGRPKPSEVVAYWGALMKKENCAPKVDVESC